MSQSSIDKITAADLAKINKYLDDAREALNQSHNPNETEEIILILREQIFHQIELQATLNEPFDITKIIQKNFQDNQALITGNDRNQVLFNIKLPNFGSKTKVPQKRENKETESTALSSKDTKTEENPILQYVLMGLALIYISTSTIPSSLEFKTTATLLVIPFIFISGFLIAKPSESWFGSNLLFIAGLIMQFISLLRYTEDHDTAFFVFFVYVLLPVLIQFCYKLLANDFISIDFEYKTVRNQIITVLGLSVLIDIFIFVPTLYYRYSLQTGALGIIQSSQYSLLIVGLLIFSVYVIAVYRWSEKFDRIEKEFSKSTDTGEKIDASNEKSETSDIQSSNDNTSYIENFLGSESDQNVLLEIEKQKAEKYFKFKLFSVFRVFVLLFALSSITISLYFRSISNGYTLIWFVNTLNLEYSRIARDIWVFKWEVVSIMNSVTIGFLAIYGFFTGLEMIRYLGKRNVKKVFDHLLMRQGIITLKQLRQTPRGVSASTYISSLSTMIMKNIISVKHIGGKS